MEPLFPVVQQSLAAQVRRLRLERGLTQERLAEGAQLDARHVQRIEAGQANPRLTTLCSLASALGTSVERLVGSDAENLDERGEG